MPKMDGLTFLNELHSSLPQSVVILMTGFGDVDTAVQAMKGGAHDFLEKPFKAKTLLDAVGGAVKRQQAGADNARLEEALDEIGDEIDGLIGRSAAMREVFFADSLRC